jgi:hypothetical protein
MPETNVKALGGWLKDADADLCRNYRRLQDIDTTHLDPQRLSYFEDYRARYFNDRLIPNQGVEEILTALDEYGGRHCRWIDLGAGVTTLFWSIGVKAPEEVAACDLVPEALHVLATFKEKDELPPCYREALTMLGRSDADFDATRNLPWTYHVVDCLSPWTVPGRVNRYDLITAIGCFGLAPDAKRYSAAFAAAAKNLSPSGRLFGADWIRSGPFIDMEGHENRFLGPALATECARKEGLSTLYVHQVSIVGDPYYDYVVVWAFGRHA